mgnify:CR=1 FL=1
MRKFKRWFHMVTLNETSKFLKLAAWMFLDSFVVVIMYLIKFGRYGQIKNDLLQDSINCKKRNHTCCA